MQKFFNRIDDLHKILETHKDIKIFLITGRDSYISSGAKSLLEPILRDRSVIHFDEVTPNPKLEDVNKAVEIYKRHNCSLILAVGGGSIIDIAKATRVIATQYEPIENVIKFNRIDKEVTGFMIAVPTTAGSGAESTNFVAIYINKQKYSLSHERALPEIVILDPSLTYKLPPYVTATSGIDAIAQAIEAYWSVQSTELSRRFSREALQKLLLNIEAAVLDPDPRSRLAMLEGANLAGRAINIAKTTACHALSYGFTAHYGIPHGQAVSFTLPYFVMFNSAISEKDCQDKRGAKFVRTRMADLFKILEVKNASLAKKRIEKLIDTVGLSCSFAPANSDGALGVLIGSIDPERLKNNPRIVSPQEAQSIIKSLCA